MHHLMSHLRALFAAALVVASFGGPAMSEELRIGYQKSSTLTAILR